MIDYVLASSAMIACCGLCVATIKGLEPIISKIKQPWQAVVCMLIGHFFGIFAFYLMIEAVK